MSANEPFLRKRRKELSESESFSKCSRSSEESRCILKQTELNEKNKDYIEYKIFNDPVHGHMRLHPLCAAIINTPQFHRLRDIKQMGLCYYVYPGASHNRFEHSIGVCHLAGKMARALKENLEKDLDIDDKDILCVEIAGLCHDMGHGPFSHTFDGFFIPQALPEGSTWKHEEASIDMFHYMREDKDNNKLQELLKKYDLQDQDFDFIAELINGPRLDFKYKGRPTKTFLYEIVSNKETGIDVDKFDYFIRDCYYLGMTSSFQLERFFLFSRVMKEEQTQQYHICLRDKEAFNVYLMFFTRNIIHRRACYHKTVKVIETMLMDAMFEVKDTLQIPHANGGLVYIADCIKKENMSAFLKLTDSAIFSEIFKLPNTDEKAKKAQNILLNIQRRNLYQLIGESEPIVNKLEDPNWTEFGRKSESNTSIVEMKKLNLQRTLLKHLGIKTSCEKNLTEQEKLELTKNNVVVQETFFDFGKGDKNPVHKVLFFRKGGEVIKGENLKVSHLFPHTHFKETVFRVILRPSDCHKTDKERFDKLRKGFENWKQVETRSQRRQRRISI